MTPEKGWKVSQSFIDFESGLLIVSESDENKDNWISGDGISQIPNRQFIIDPKKGLILNHTDWSQYFNYKTIENQIFFKFETELEDLFTRVKKNPQTYSIPDINSMNFDKELNDWIDNGFGLGQGDDWMNDILQEDNEADNDNFYNDLLKKCSFIKMEIT